VCGAAPQSMQEAAVCGRARLVFLSDPRGGMQGVHVRRPMLVGHHVRTTLINSLFGGRHALQITVLFTADVVRN